MAALEYSRSGSDSIIKKPKKEYFNIILETRDYIAEIRKKEITFSEPFMWLNGDPIFYPNTINVIQGKTGVHKSRLVQDICSALLKKQNCDNILLGLLANNRIKTNVLYVDTERNIKDQFPFAVRQIFLRAGHDPAIDLDNFDVISLMEIDRNDRFMALEEYIGEIRKIYTEHIVIILDVVTDCINSFNDPKESMSFIDMMNRFINKQAVTFICLIHENPGNGSEKARGHLGTEITNKASTVIQIGFEKETDIVKINFTKCRNSKRPEPTFAYYSESEKGLVLADNKLVREALDKNRDRATVEQVVKELPIILTGDKKRTDIYAHLIEEFNCSEKTI